MMATGEMDAHRMTLPQPYRLEMYQGDSYAWEFRLWADAEKTQADRSDRRHGDRPGPPESRRERADDARDERDGERHHRSR